MVDRDATRRPGDGLQRHGDTGLRWGQPSLRLSSVFTPLVPVSTVHVLSRHRALALEGPTFTTECIIQNIARFRFRVQTVTDHI